MILRLEAAANDLRTRQRQMDEVAEAVTALRERLGREGGQLRAELVSCTAELSRVALRERTTAAEQQSQQQGAAGGTSRRGLVIRLGRGAGGGAGGGEGLVTGSAAGNRLGAGRSGKDVEVGPVALAPTGMRVEREREQEELPINKKARLVP